MCVPSTPGRLVFSFQVGATVEHLQQRSNSLMIVLSVSGNYFGDWEKNKASKHWECGQYSAPTEGRKPPVMFYKFKIVCAF